MICRRNYKTNKGYSVLWFSSTGVDELGHAKFYGVNSNLRYINIINKKLYNPLMLGTPEITTKSIIKKGSYVFKENPELKDISHIGFDVNIEGSTLTANNEYGDISNYNNLTVSEDYIYLSIVNISGSISYDGTSWIYYIGSNEYTVTDTTRLRTIYVKEDIEVPIQLKSWWDNNTTLGEEPQYDVGYVDGDNIYIWCTLLGELNYHNINDVQANLIENGYAVTIVEKNENLPKYITESKNYVGEQQGVVDSLIQRLSVIKGELWYNPTYGLPLVDKIRSKGLMDAAVADIIYNQPDVELINSFTSDIGKSHIYSFDFSVITIYTPDSVRARLEVGS